MEVPSVQVLQSSVHAKRMSSIPSFVTGILPDSFGEPIHFCGVCFWSDSCANVLEKRIFSFFRTEQFVIYVLCVKVFRIVFLFSVL